MAATGSNTRSGVSRVGIVIAALSTLGLSLALMISPAIAHHETPNPEVTPKLLAGNPVCPAGTTEIKFDGSELSAGSQKQTTIGTTTVRVEILETDGMYITFDVDNAVAAHVLVKGGDNANDYDYSARSDGGIRHDDHLIAPDNGGGQQPKISHVSFCLVLPPASGTATATATATIPAGGDDASLNVRKNDQDGRRLPGAVFTVDGLPGTYTTDAEGTFCILGLPDDSVWLVTEIQAPPGYEIGQPASQMVEVDNDGDCNSPDAVFTNSLSTSTATPTPEGSVGGGTSTPTPEGSVQGGTGTPAPSQPDTAMGGMPGPSPVPTFAFAIVLLASIGTLAYANVRSTRRNR